jgi:1,4-alpha-glucan branching enzyme
VAVSIILLAPSPPLLFMGEEFGCLEPFLFFCDFGPDLARSVTQGRRREFSKFPDFEAPSARDSIPDPNQVSTFERSKLNWASLSQPSHRRWLAYYRALLALRGKHIIPRLSGIHGSKSAFRVRDHTPLIVTWLLGDGSELNLVASLGQELSGGADRPKGAILFETNEGIARDKVFGTMPRWYAAWFLDSGDTE